MARFTNDVTGVTVSVDDSKSDRFAEGWSAAGDSKSGSTTKRTTARRSSSSKSDDSK